LRLITRAISPYRGEGIVRLLGKDRWDKRDLVSLIGVVESAQRVTPLGEPSALDWVATARIGSRGVLAFEIPTEADYRDAQVALDQIGAGHLAERTIETLSAGERQRVEIARALVTRPRLLVLDEPTSSLDLIAAKDLIDDLSRLAQGGTTLMLVTHHPHEIVPEIERVILMSEGAIFADGPKAETLTPHRLSALFGRPVEVAWRAGRPVVWAA
jgi:iron complex transport system ATP-binding protein